MALALLATGILIAPADPAERSSRPTAGRSVESLPAAPSAEAAPDTQSAAAAPQDVDASTCAAVGPCVAAAERAEPAYELKEVRHVTVTTFDGVQLDGWIALPTVPAGVRTPVVLQTSPYFDSFEPMQASLYRDPASPVNEPVAPGWWEDGELGVVARVHSPGFPPIRLIRRGYTLAYFSVRGTGSSGGCFEWGGANEQRDQVALVDWLAAQPWSNGRVGITGLSYMAYSAWQAAVQAPAALRTIITAGDVTNLYELAYTPQGARGMYTDIFHPEYELSRQLGGGLLSGRPDFAGHTACAPGLTAQKAIDLATGDRSSAYWTERALLPRLGSVKAAVLGTGGYFDVGGHEYQDAAIWGALPPRTPRVQFRGWWGHEFPTEINAWGTTLDLPSGATTWETVVTRWLDFYLKGRGPAPRTGVAYHQDQQLKWHEDRRWTPQPAKREALYLAGPELGRRPLDTATSFRSAPQPLDQTWTEHANGVEEEGSGFEQSLCGDPLGLSAKYQTAPLASAALLAGSPFVYLDVESDLSGGLVGAALYDVGPDFACTGPHYDGARWIADGAADLNYYETPYQTTPFPVATRRRVRIDLSDVTWSLEPGHRLVLLLSRGEVFQRGSTSLYPTISVHGPSHVVLPVAKGSVGGVRPPERYPQRPFTPAGYRD